MDADRLATLLRAWMSGPTRRDLARALGGTVLAVPLTALLGTVDGAAKKKKKKKKKCKSSQKKCGKKCIPADNCCLDDDCAGGSACQDGTCHVCINVPCQDDSDCCVGFCDPETQTCDCIKGGQDCGAATECCSRCCEGKIEPDDIGKCACDPPGTACAAGDDARCCSNDCVVASGQPFGTCA